MFRAFRIFAGGWSAGGHLAAVACREPHVQGTLAISGIFDLEPITLTYLNDKLTLSRNEIETLSPQRVLSGGMAALCVAVGGNELTELKRQSLGFADSAIARELPVTLRTLSGHHHFSILEKLAKPDGALTVELIRLTA